ncbi:Mrp/NBP35 family ATP-binding protein [Porphyromonas sp. COT-239 OH1446]|uniref:Mrp/NBP35 family ATP-binding protein n=1 Tax=Porphyromonas sp. COT-239 OH1446 TaxID=1515613 RepID=UPI00052BD136|nr:Mrp/NBP35 family ATP-binding protein [Porphyromonas sp. COT-239 OH1446]KGN70166.1 sodium:proton antiporter [Porphyromonas sp. COT-239 OH1446]
MATTIYPNLILEALSKVRYPGTGKNLVEAGMVEDDIRIDGLKVSFSLIFDKPNSPFVKSVVKAAETAILTYVGPDVEIKGNISVKMPELQPKVEAKLLPGVKNVVAIFSGKGGVGKSTVSANLAVALAQAGYRVGLLDADIFGPSMPKMFGCEDARPVLEEVDGRELIAPVERYGVKLLSIGFFIDKASPVLWRGSMASNALKQLLSEGNWGELDYLLLDMPPGTSDIHLTLVQTLGLTGALVVTTPQQVAIADAIKGIGMFLDEKVGVPILGLVENMAWFTPRELPENRYYIFGRDGGRALAEEMGIPLLGQIPLVQGICEAGDEGAPSAIQTNSMTGIFFRTLAANLVEQVERRNAELAPTQRVEMTH